MKKLNIKLLASALLILGACSQDVIDLQAPETTTPETTTPSKGNADFTKFVSIGNSLTAGFQAGALFTEGQQNSLPLILSKQFSLAQGTTLAFNQPDINSVNGYYTVVGGKVLGRLILFDADGTGPKTPAPAPAGTTGMPAPYTGGDVPTAFTGDKTKLNNFAVPGILLGQALIPDTGNPASPYYNGLWARFASQPGVKSILQDAIAAQPSFFLFDLGNNDILGYATGGGSNPAIFTSEANFQGQYNSAITALLTANPNAKGVIANIPDVTTIPFFTTVAWNAIALDAATSSTLTTNLANNYNAFLDGMIAAKYISAEEGAKRKLSYKAGANGILLSDETLTDLTPYMNASANTQPLIPYARARQATATDLITLSAGSILGTAVPGTGGTAVYGVSYPVGDQYVLIPTETAEVKARTTAFNNIIKNAADGSNGRLALADVNATFTALVNARAGVYNGVTITPNFAPPTGAFSEDGVHPNSRGYAFMANIFIDAINAKFSANVPKASIADYKGTGLPVSAQ
ncbi:MAG: hypothetical protein DI538_13395 [Azospira oryzae]|nr:MAG: hypothetical protein DI538_13395 [Azospira oryzae]